MTKNIMLDTGFLIALCDPTDEQKRRENAVSLYELIEKQNVIIPWPILYETFRTKYSRKNNVLVLFEAFLKKNNVHYLDDSPYRENVYIQVIDSYNKQKKRYSMVDFVIREIIADINVKIDYLITFNQKDFQDICSIRQIEIY